MVVRYVTKNGGVMMGPPYTEEEEQDLYRRIAGGPWTVLRTAKTPQTVGSEAAATNPETEATSQSVAGAADPARSARSLAAKP
jgi:hypothetical protein